jgi:hypothetical protein
MSDLDLLRAKILLALRSEACLKINFSVASMPVTGIGYAVIAAMVETQCIKIGTGGTSPGANANYDWRSTRLIFRDLSQKQVSFYATADGRAEIVHECTHAVIDFTQKGKTVKSAHNEFAAWLAQKVYAINAGDKPFNQGYIHAPLFRIAIQISRMGTSGVFQVDPADVADIGGKIRAAHELNNKA